jgi:hypothetical protein
MGHPFFCELMRREGRASGAKARDLSRVAFGTAEAVPCYRTPEGGWRRKQGRDCSQPCLCLLDSAGIRRLGA